MGFKTRSGRPENFPGPGTYDGNYAAISSSAPKFSLASRHGRDHGN